MASNGSPRFKFRPGVPPAPVLLNLATPDIKMDSCHGTPPDPPGTPSGTASIAQYRNFSVGLNLTG